MLSCGESSGDLYAGALLRELRALDPAIQVRGLGGPEFGAAGGELLEDYRGLSVTGLTEAVGKLAQSFAALRRLVDSARRDPPDALVAIDFPDFNFRLARAIKRLGIPVVYYISPQLWAWRRGRLKTMRRVADRVLVIFPFEAPFYEEAGVPVTFVGHPLLELLPDAGAGAALLRAHAIDPARPLIAILPGSRRNEVRAILPDLVKAAGLIAERVPTAQFVVARAPHLDDELFAPLHDWPAGAAPAVVIEGATDAVLAAARVAVVASGTVTVQAALHGCPMVVVYRLGPLTYRIGRPLVHVDTFAMVNLVAGRKVVPELIQDDFTPAAVAAEALRVLTDPAHAAAVRAELAAVRARLGTPGASRRAAEAVLETARAGRRYTR